MKTKIPPSVTPIESAKHVGEGTEESKGADSAGWRGRGGSNFGCGNGDMESSFLLVTWSNVVLCEGNVLQLYDFAGVKVLPFYY